MAFLRPTKYFLLVTIVLVLIATQVDGRRKILKGRKALTRTYLRESILPAWVLIVLGAIGEILVGAIAYLIMKKVILDPPITGSYTPTATDP